ncbi:MAG TPA: FxsA family protein [Pseudonocardia sp.]|nr:FxsA family protein [Pseudonocardia sp.]
MKRYIGLYLLVELLALVAAVNWLGFAATVLLLMVGGLAGMWLVRREGARAALALADAVRLGRSPHAEVTDGALIGLAGLFFVLPGIVSDLMGLLLVLPATRALARRRLTRLAERRSPVLRTAWMRDGHTVVDGVVIDDPHRTWTWQDLPRQSIEP